MLVSRRYLPLIGIHLFASLLYGFLHQRNITARNCPGKLEQLSPCHTVRRSKRQSTSEC